MGIDNSKRDGDIINGHFTLKAGNKAPDPSELRNKHNDMRDNTKQKSEQSHIIVQASLINKSGSK